MRQAFRCERLRVSGYGRPHSNVRPRRNLVNDHKKIGIVGGHPTDAKSLKASFNSLSSEAHIKFKETLGQSTPDHRTFREKYSDVDLLIVFTGFVGHSQTRHADMVEKEEGIPVIRLEKMPSETRPLMAEILCTLRELIMLDLSNRSFQDSCTA